MTLSLPSQLADLLPPGSVVPPACLEGYAVDGVVPQAAALVSTREDTAEVLRWAAAQGVSVFPRGGGTQMALGNVPAEVGLALDLSGQDRMLDYQPADLTVTVEAGISLDRLQQELAPGGKFLPLEAPLAEISTVGGILAANATGPLRTSYGQPREWLIGISVVGGDGVETKAGGKVVKNVTGYDLNKLYAGSLGTLGIIAEATFKLAPVPAEMTAVLASFSSLAEGIKAGGGLAGTSFAPNGVQVLDGQGAQRLQLDQGREMLEQAGAGSALAAAFIAGGERGVKRRTDETVQLLRESGAGDVAVLQAVESQTLLADLTNLGWNEETKPYLSMRVAAPPSAVAAVAAQCVETNLQAAAQGMAPGVAADPGFGLVRLYWWVGAVSEWVDDGLLLETLLRTRRTAREAGGQVVVEHCPPSLKKQIDVWGGQPESIELMRRLKGKFDPSGILNPRRFVGGI